MNVLLLSAYAAQSHRHWRKQLLAMFPSCSWTVLEMPARYFSWRVRGNALFWSFAEKATLRQEYDLVIATSMVDLATLRGLCPQLANSPTILYFHENQFAYPQQGASHGLVEAQMLSVYSALAADRLLFNSMFNRESFYVGCGELLQRLPDFVPSGVVDHLSAKSVVVPVPLSAEVFCTPRSSGAISYAYSKVSVDTVKLLWVGRFEYDKGGDLLLQTLRELERLQVNYQLAVVGQQFRNMPVSFSTIAVEFKHRLSHFGYVEQSADYHSVLRASDIVLSTALHEFQGISVLEAVASGCVPVVPDRLAYPEVYPASNRYQYDAAHPEKEAQCAAALIADVAADIPVWRARLPDVSRYRAGALKIRYQQAFDAAQAAYRQDHHAQDSH